MYGVTAGMGSLGNRPRVGGATLPSILRINAAGRRTRVYAKESKGTGGLLFLFCRGLPFCLQVRQKAVSFTLLSGHR
jgi:hypothetical protein